MREMLTVDNGDGTTTEFRIIAKGPTVHVRMAHETAEEWLVRLSKLLALPGAKAIAASSGSVIAVEVAR